MLSVARELCYVLSLICSSLSLVLSKLISAKMPNEKQLSDEDRQELQGLIVNITILNGITVSFV